MTTPLLEAIVEGLTPEERQELQDAIDYMAEHAHTGTPEGSIARVVNGLSPNVRAKFELVSEMLETPRMRPFDPKMGNDEYAEALGADPQTLANVKNRLDSAAVVQGLQRRMETDASLAYGQPEQPLSLKEQLAAALEAHGSEQYFVPEMTNASAHRPMKDAVRIIMEKSK